MPRWHKQKFQLIWEIMNYEACLKTRQLGFDVIPFSKLNRSLVGLPFFLGSAKKQANFQVIRRLSPV